MGMGPAGWMPRAINGRLACLLAAAAIALLTGCGGSDAESDGGGAAADGGEPVTLRLLMPATAQPGVEALVSAFRSSPEGKGITVEAEYSARGVDTGRALVTQLQASNAPDLFYVASGNSGVNGAWPLADAGRVLDLSGEELVENVYEPGREFVSREEKVYGLPMSVIVFGLLVNQQRFDELGLTEPESFADVLAICEDVAASGDGTAFAQGFAEPVQGSQIGQILAGRFVYAIEPDWNQQRADGAVTFADSEHWRRALEAVVDMKDAGCFPRGAAGTNREGQYAMIVEGEGAFQFGASTDIAAVGAIDPDVEMRLMSLPGDDPSVGTAAYTFSGISIGINAETEHPDEARAFLNWAGQDDQLRTFSEATASIAPVDVQQGAVPDFVSEKTAEALKAGDIVNGPHSGFPNTSVFDEAYVTGVLGLLTGQTTIDDVLKSMDRAWDASG
jgi:raffinose/stachyose/melibiose transport system substrate-binding protein